MIKIKTGVYTVECPKCKSFTIIHLGPDGSINPHRCSKCELEFRGIGSGNQRHSFVGLVKEGEVRPESDSDTRSEKKTQEKEEHTSTKKGAFKIKIVKNKDS